MSERIQKLLATAGIASRRAIETMIADGRVTVNGRPAEVGQRIDHDDHVRVDTRLVALNRKAEPARVLLYRKKVGELVTRDDPEGRKTVFRKLPELTSGRWIAIGRLDINTSGLLLLTNDGELARRLMHPSFEMRREYAVRVLGSIDSAALARLRAGVELEDGYAKFETITPGENHGGVDDGEGDDAPSSANSWWTVTVKQGRNRVVRRLFESQNTQVSRLMRVSYGPITLGRGIKSGSYRESTDEELQALLEAVDMAEKKPARASSKKAPHARRKPMPEHDAPQQPAKPRRSPRAAAEAERKRDFFDRGDKPAGAKPRGDSRPGAKSGPKREARPAGPAPRGEFRPASAAPKREFRSDAAGTPKRGSRADAAAAPKREFRADAAGAPKREFRSDAAGAARRESRPAAASGEFKRAGRPTGSRSESAREPRFGGGSEFRGEGGGEARSGAAPKRDARPAGSSAGAPRHESRPGAGTGEFKREARSGAGAGDFKREPRSGAPRSAGARDSRGGAGPGSKPDARREPRGDAPREPRRDDARPKPAGRSDKPAGARSAPRKSPADAARKRSPSSDQPRTTHTRRGESAKYPKKTDPRPPKKPSRRK